MELATLIRLGFSLIVMGLALFIITEVTGAHPADSALKPDSDRYPRIPARIIVNALIDERNLAPEGAVYGNNIAFGR